MFDLPLHQLGIPSLRRVPPPVAQSLQLGAPSAWSPVQPGRVEQTCLEAPKTSDLTLFSDLNLRLFQYMSGGRFLLVESALKVVEGLVLYTPRQYPGDLLDAPIQVWHLAEVFPFEP